MAFTLRLTVHGVLGCVERTEEGKPAFTVLCCEYEKQPLVAFVKFPRDSYKGSRIVQGDIDHPDAGYIQLKSEHLTVDADAAPADAALKLNKNRDPISSTPTALDAESLVWIPDIDELSDGHGAINSGYFDSPPKAKPALVARLDLTAGRVGTTGVERVQVPFSDGNGTSYRRPIAREIRMQMEVQAEHFTLRSKALNGSSRASQDMEFTAKPGSTLDIVFGHDTEKSIFDAVPPIAPIDVIEQQARDEYRFYYKMCQNGPKDRQVLPLVASRPGGEPFCSPSKFKTTVRSGT